MVELECPLVAEGCTDICDQNWPNGGILKILQKWSFLTIYVTSNRHNLFTLHRSWTIFAPN
jgi:hypothetical protein